VAGTGPASGTVSVAPTSGIALALTGVFSRKTHNLGGDFDLAVDNSQPIAGAVTVEPRVISTGHKIVFQFNDTIASVGGATCVDAGTVAVGATSVSISGTSVIVTLTGIPDGKRVTVSITGVNGTNNAATSIGFLAGDVNSSRSVTSADILMISGRNGQVVNSTNFRFDIDLNGSINSQDTGYAHINAGVTLP